MLFAACFLSLATLVVSSIASTPPSRNPHVVRQDDSDPACPCCDPVNNPDQYAVIYQPANGTTFTLSAEDQCNDNSFNFQVIYCSGQVIETYTIQTDTWLGGFQVLAYGTQPVYEEDTGFSGYNYSVSVVPADGDYGYILGWQQLTVYEIFSEYYHPYGYETHTVLVNFELAPMNGTECD